ncbi:M18 family aminopeptidase [Gordonia liuliyuniae]|uniref:M18 family aminopeptidase n=1 Tax=Gordonia liuliyuniae TaxID=2911517 RepID=A0ABS9ISL8_9ACTN|nr:M18 family aminopeptidase [Gordonia liuliyuniae]MCF8588529.1 M18 family aminopeptidase [Gordonia liuliyuniae]
MTTTASAVGLGEFIDSSPSPFHVCATVAATLDDAGYTRVFEDRPWSGDARRGYVVRGGSIIAWDASVVDSFRQPGNLPFRIVGGHTDSPNLRLKQYPDRRAAGLSTVALEPYGGAWLNSWLDRDLGLSGRIAYADGASVAHTLVEIDEPILRVPQLAIHLSEDRKGVHLDPQRHVDALWSLDETASIMTAVAERAGVDPAAVLGWELMAHDVTPSRIIGGAGEFLSAPRLDNQGTCYSGLRALLDAQRSDTVAVLALFDHEEVGSGSERGASSDFLVTVLERLVAVNGGGRDEFLQVMAASVCASGDMAHATHPNYPDRHEHGHRIAVNGGPVLKVNQNLRYASDATGEAEFAMACRDADVPLQRYVHRADLPCGSTIGPLTATRTGLLTVDVGAPQLAMHSCRELMGVDDVVMYSKALRAFFERPSR